MKKLVKAIKSGDLEKLRKLINIDKTSIKEASGTIILALSSHSMLNLNLK